ncbi:hypothetical protein Vafri_19898 [Volvox africanus]|uniref:Patatin n=1 Tax=Volvox africanus TaxID=51714 RepID=A0A8J4BQE7_9CHLO|nr:hypothetical protein Vafri_19898 [Volvox africanus]
MGHNKWPYVVVGDRDLEGYKKQPTLLSLDGGGMRGLITAQVLIQVEDSIKQVLWKERLIKMSAVRKLLEHATGRGQITEIWRDDLLKSYAKRSPTTSLPPPPSPNPRTDANFEEQWQCYYGAQKRLLESPENWDIVKKCFDIDIADYFEQLAGTSTGGLLALYFASRGGQQDAGTKEKGPELKSSPEDILETSGIYADNGMEMRRISQEDQNIGGKLKIKVVSRDGQLDVEAKEKQPDLKSRLGSVDETSGGTYEKKVRRVRQRGAKAIKMGRRRVHPAPAPPGNIQQNDACVKEKVNDLKSRPGSAQGASDFYVDNGAKIFSTDWKVKLWRFLQSGGKYQHSAEGLEKVLETVFGDMTMQDLEQYGTNVLVSTIDAAKARSAFFVHTSARRPPILGDPSPAASSGTSAFATTLRRTDKGKLVLVRDFTTSGDLVETLDSVASRQLSAGFLIPKKHFGREKLSSQCSGNATNIEEINFLTAMGGWTVPIQFEKLNFKLRDVARATSAAPALLPPKVVKPTPEQVTSKRSPAQQAAVQAADLKEVVVVEPSNDPIPDDWSNRVFLDGGLSNNDPVYLGLQAMMQRNNNARLEDCAILSIGTGTKASFNGYPPPAAKTGWLKWLSNNMCPFNIWQTIQNIVNLVSLTMTVNGEDKENFLRLIFYGLMRVPMGTYLRIQVIDEFSDLNVQQRGYNDKTLERWREALGKTDDPSPKTLDVYKEMGYMLANIYSLRLVWWVRCFIFGLEAAANFPFVQDVKDVTTVLCRLRSSSV